MEIINIKDSLYKDDRWFKLISVVGCKYKALGLLVNAWSLGQKHWKHEGVPRKYWSKDFDVLLECEFATKLSEEMYYIKGSKKAFKIKLQKSKGGKKSAELRKNVSDQIKQTKNPRGLKRSSRGVNTSSRGLEDKNIELSSSETQTKEPVSDKILQIENSKLLSQKCWESYKNAYLKTWKKEPIRNALVNSQINSIVKRLGKDAPNVIDFYVNHKDSFFVKHCHPIGLCLQNAEGLHTQWVKNQPITGATIKQYETQQQFYEQQERILKGEL